MEKTMERYDAAIEHFKVLLAEPKREVFALSMIGECHEALGDSAEAIRCYQDALKRPSATAAEATQLYYQLGNVFRNLGDQSEALYYFERVLQTRRELPRHPATLGQAQSEGWSALDGLQRHGSGDTRALRNGWNMLKRLDGGLWMKESRDGPPY